MDEGEGQRKRGSGEMEGVGEGCWREKGIYKGGEGDMKMINVGAGGFGGRKGGRRGEGRGTRSYIYTF